MTDSFLEDLYREMYQKLYAYARVRLRDEQLAQEVTQDIFVLAQEKLGELLKQRDAIANEIRFVPWDMLCCTPNVTGNT